MPHDVAGLAHSNCAAARRTWPCSISLVAQERSIRGSRRRRLARSGRRHGGSERCWQETDGARSHVMQQILAVAGGGLLLGLVGSLHCACMCGGIASGALFLINPETPRQRLTSLLLLQTGRIATYTLAGAAVGGLTSMTIDPASTAMSFRTLQWLGAAI